MICVDASVAVKWVLDEERGNRARALFRATERAGRDIAAPPLLPFEVTNTLRQRTRTTHGLSLVAATELLDRFLALPITIYYPDDLHPRALALAQTFDLPAAYDAHYLALDEHLDCELWTDDDRLARRVGNTLSIVRRLSHDAIPA